MKYVYLSASCRSRSLTVIIGGSTRSRSPVNCIKLYVVVYSSSQIVGVQTEMALFCQLAIGLLLLCGLPRAPGRHVDDAVLPVGRAMTRSRGKVVSGQFSSHTGKPYPVSS